MSYPRVPLQISGYVDPGVYIGEVIVPGAVNIATTPAQIGIIGPGDRQKAIANEAVQRGLVQAELLTVLAPAGSSSAISAPVSSIQTISGVTPATLTADIIGLTVTIKGDTHPTNNGNFPITNLVSSSSFSYFNPLGVVSTSPVTFTITPHATLANRSDRTLQNTSIFRNGVALSSNFIGYQQAFIQGNIVATRNLTAPNNAMAISLDGKVELTIHFVAGGGVNGVVQAGGAGSTQFDATIASALATAAFSDIAAVINLALAAATDSALQVNSGAGYGSAYAAAASVNSVGLRITSPLTTPLADVQVLPPIANDLNANAVSRFFLTEPQRAPSVVTISPLQYSGSSAYTADYINITATEDPLLNAGVQAITLVGNLAGVGTYVEGTDFIQDGDKIDWGGPGNPPPLPPFFPPPGVIGSPVSPYNLSGGPVSPANAGVTGTVTVFASGIGHFLASAPDAPVFSASSVGRLLTITGGPDAGTWLIVSFINNAEVYFAMTGVVLDATPRAWSEKTINNTLRLAFDNQSFVDVNLAKVNDPTASLTNPILGYTYNLGGQDASLLPASTVAANINATVGSSAFYGPEYDAVASSQTIAGSTFLQLTSPTVGQAGVVQVLAPSAGVGSAAAAVLGLAPTSLPVLAMGKGKQPIPGSIYFVSYSITRPVSDYNVQKRFFTLSDAVADLGAVTAQNPLMVAVQLAFTQTPPSVVVVQVDDVTVPGSPTRQEFLNALNATTNSDVITDVVVLSTSLDVQTDLKDHIENESSPQQKQYRRGWFGMPLNTPIGDKDTPGSFVYMATRTLQYAPDSPGRGRAILVAPPQLSGVTYTITLPTGAQQTLALDSTYIAVALASKKTSFTNPAISLAKKTVSGFNVADQTKGWNKVQRGLLASQGTMVLSFEAGNFLVRDPVTTEKGGGGLAAFSYESTSSQKDNISRKVDQALDANVVGIVPTDLSDFIVDIKLIIASVLEGEIGAAAIAPFKNPNGSPRDINLATDLQVQQDPNDPTKFFFSYYFNLRYPALRLFGQFSVDNPFFSSTGT